MSKQRKGTLRLLVVVLALALAGCGDDDDSGSSGGSATSTGFEPVNDGVLTVLTNLPNPGFWNGNNPDDISGGFEYGMAQEIAERLDLEDVQVVNTSFDALVAGQVKDYDLGLATVTITDERKEILDFSVPYFASDQGILVKTGTEVTEDNHRDISWGVLTSSTSETFLKDVLEVQTDPNVYPDQPSMYAAVASGQIDAALLDTVSVLPVAEESGGTLAVVGQYKTGDTYGAVFPKDDPEAAQISDVIAEMIDDGTMDELRAEYLVPVFGVDPASVPYLAP